MAGPTPTLYVLRHEPGRDWVAGTPFREQIGVEGHLTFMRSLLERGVLVMGGAFQDGSGAMAIVRADSLDAAEDLAFEDPTVGSLLLVTVRPWRPVMSSLDL